MGASKITNFQKCGDILINIKTIKNKTKVYTFHCGFCSVDCDQLKKFSKHLEEKHLYIFDDNDFEVVEEPSKAPTLLYEPEEIKEELEITECDTKANLIANKSLDGFIDPLDTMKSEVDKEDLKSICENDLEVNKKKINLDIETVEEFEEEKNNKEETFGVIDSTMEEYSDDSNDTDFDIGRKINKSKPSLNNSKKQHKRKSKIELTTAGDDNELNIVNKLKRRRRPIYENLLPFLIKQYKKYDILWQVDNIEFGVKNKNYEVYGKIAKDIKLDQDQNISLEDVKYHINYLNQLYSKDREQEIKCNLEKKNFVPEYELYTEMSFLDQSQGPFLCPICNEILPRYDPYCQHMAEHSGNPPFKCPSCSLTFNKYHKYMIHKKRHLGILNYHCNVCGKGYLFKNDLEWHVTSHTGDKPFLCQVCGRGFRARHGYDNHIRRHEERFRYECHICKRGFNFLYALNTHIKSHLNIRDIICKICGKGFTDTRYLRRHELIHGDVKGYKCNICGKAFFQACGLRAHRKNHHS